MSKQIVDFIQTLNKSEKRYIHLYLKTFSGKDTINLQDFLEIEKSTARKKYIPKIKGNTTRLYYKLLDILAEYHRENLNNYNIDYINLNRAKLLFHKGNSEEAEKLIGKILENPSDTNHLIKVEAIELRLMNAVNHGDVNYLAQQFESDKAQLKVLSDEYTNLINYELLWAASKYENSSSYFFENRNNYTDKQYSDFLTNEEQAISPMAKILYNKIKGYESIKKRNVDEAVKYSKRAIDIFDENKELIKTNTIEFLKSIRNYCIALNHKNQIKEAESLLDVWQLKLSSSILNKNIATKIESFTLFSLIRMDLIINARLLRHRIAQVEDAEKKFNEIREYLPKDQFLASAYQFVLFNLSGDYPRKAIRYINLVLKNSDSTRKDIYQLTMMAELVVHFRLGNVELLESKLNTFKKYLQKEELVFGFAHQIPVYFSKLIREPEENKHYKNLISEIENNLLKEKKEFYLHFNPLLYLKN
ncbi:MAG: hypothetical protein J0L69_12805 [Bacteroidetes bacterium]|nr:hypothetical protein [Bacteroidota bacterium]